LKKIAIYLLNASKKDAQATVQEKPSALRKEHPARQNMKFFYFFLYFWVIFAFLDPDQATQINADPDPQPCMFPRFQ
jgi:hypothetical protein